MSDGYYAKVILDSVSPAGDRLTTMEVRYPRFIHSEMLTHRAFSRNSASSRAIPNEKLLGQVKSEPVMPLSWQVEAGGMQGAGSLPPGLAKLAEAIWLQARDDAASHAWRLRNIAAFAGDVIDASDRGDPLGVPLERHEVQAIRQELDEMDDEPLLLHKTMANRIVEPWMWITVIITATDWKNFFRLRCHPDAEQHMQHVAYMMQAAYENSAYVPREIHLPYVDGIDLGHCEQALKLECPTLANVDAQLAKISAARCARVSYLTHEGKRDWRKDLELFEKLANGSGFGHWSPMEHPAIACEGRHGNFNGWKQFRKIFSNECADN